ncbi:zf-HC2 domain-containing protein [Dactylosporangium sp. NPDC005572]|uniref:zf-HC2 domain-containing protein n=1 Tax=Dactylosporangium sp. NPDC005572 TaxID=3156889 RepID=UPI0033A1D69D
MSWHIDETTWRAYAAGRLDAVAESAVEEHVTSCPGCRDGARMVVGDVEPLWHAVHHQITAQLTAPAQSRVLRLLARLKVPGADLVVVGAARDLLTSWSVAVGAAVCCALLTGLVPVHLPGGPPALFLVIAPLIPVLAVVAAYDATDPLREITETTPFSKLRLALLRAAAALTAAVPLTVAVALAVPALRGYFATWLLPGLALTVTALILLTWLTAWIACAVVGGGWLAAALAAAAADRIDGAATGPGQAAFALVVVVLGVVLVHVTTTQHTRGVAP